MASKSQHLIRKLFSIVAAACAARPQVTLHGGMGTQSMCILTLSRHRVNGLLSSVLNYKGSWLDWTAREGKQST
jgi:3-mercaptopyruvate sulfurtransferase SseA